MIRTAVIAVCALFSTAVCAVSAIAVSFFTRGGNLAHLVGRVWGRSILWASRIKVTVLGMEHIDPTAPYVYMANHQSMFDILTLLGYLPVQFRWLAKKELFKIPIFGYSMARVGYISIDRSNRRSAIESLNRAAKKIADGVSVVIFPEGTRSADGNLRAFKKGGFYLAIDSRQPIVPVVISGSHEIMPKGVLRVRRGEITLSINPPVKTSAYHRATKEALMERIWSVMDQDLKRLKADQNARDGIQSKETGP
jgi:1-acyl-sn-glycerol-3-phosphate acyltransferase